MSYRSAMSWRGSWMVLGTCGVLLATAARANVEASETPSQHVFVVRNPFGLSPPPTNTEPNAPVAPPVKVDLKLAGITSDSAGKRAWIVIPPSPARPGVPAVTNALNYAIAEGGREGDIEVLSIDTEENTVRLLNAGVEVTLDFDNNGLAAPVALPGVPGARRGAPRVVPRPGAPVAVPSPANAAASRRIKSSSLNRSGSLRTSSTRSSTPALSPAATANTLAPSTALRTIPARNVRTTPAAPEAIDPVTQVILMRANEAQARAGGRLYPPLPPIPGGPPPPQ